MFFGWHTGTAAGIERHWSHRLPNWIHFCDIIIILWCSQIHCTACRLIAIAFNINRFILFFTSRLTTLKLKWNFKQMEISYIISNSQEKWKKNYCLIHRKISIWKILKFQVFQGRFSHFIHLFGIFSMEKYQRIFSFDNWWNFHFTFRIQSSTCCAISSGVRCNRPWHTGHDWHCELRICSGYSDSESPLRLRVFARKRPWRFVRIRWNVYNFERRKNEFWFSWIDYNFWTNFFSLECFPPKKFNSKFS